MNDWIPISEREPEENKYVLLSFDQPIIPAIGRFEGGEVYLDDDTKITSGATVNAWMPLPKSYKKSKKEIELSVLQLVRFMEECEKVAKENWLDSQCEMLDRLFTCVIKRCDYNEV